MPKFPVAENIKAGTYEGITTIARTEIESIIDRDDWYDMGTEEKYNAVYDVVEELTTDNRTSIMRMLKSVMTEKGMLEEEVVVADLPWDHDGDTIRAIDILREVLIIRIVHDVVVEAFGR